MESPALSSESQDLLVDNDGVRRDMNVKWFMLEVFASAKKLMNLLEFISEYDELIFRLYEKCRLLGELKPLMALYDEEREKGKDTYPKTLLAAREIYLACRSAHSFCETNLKNVTSDNRFRVCKENGVQAVMTHFRTTTCKYGTEVADRISKRSAINVILDEITEGIAGLCQGMGREVPKLPPGKEGSSLIYDRIASKDSGQSARKFWTDTAGKALFVDLNTFVEKFAEHFRFEVGSIDRLKIMIDWSGDSWVSAREFEMLLSYFGPFEELGERIVDVITQPYFYGYLTHKESEDLYDTPMPGMVGITSGKPEQFRNLPSSFLVRLSLNHPGTLYLHYMSNKNLNQRTKKVPIYLSSEGYYAQFPEKKEEDVPVYIQTKSTTEKVKHFKCLTELIQSIKKARHPVMARGKNVMEHKYVYLDKYAGI